MDIAKRQLINYIILHLYIYIYNYPPLKKKEQKEHSGVVDKILIHSSGMPNALNRTLRLIRDTALARASATSEGTVTASGAKQT